ncbi:tetratricopeptide repeat protein, partial [Candidatus Dependentiae bacterium]|nr:tetratricopeptide repeat protein [Candidatus Dependentiae bacterium]
KIYSVKLKDFKNNAGTKIRLLKKILELTPDRDDLIYDLAVKYFETGKINESITKFENIYKKFPDYKDAGQYLVKGYFKTGNTDKVNSLLDSGIDIANDRELLNHGARLMLNQKKYKTAISFLVKLKLLEESPEVYKSLGDAYSEEQNFELAIQHYERYMSMIHHQTPDLLKKMAELCLKTDDSVKAYNYYKKYHESGTGAKNKEIISILADLGKKIGQTEYIKFYEELLSENSGDIGILIELFNYNYSDKAKREKYCNAVINALAKRTDAADYKFEESVLEKIIETFYDNKRYADIIKYGEKRKLNPKLQIIFENSFELLGDSFYAEKKYKEAKNYYEIAYDFKKNKNGDLTGISEKLGNCGYYLNDYAFSIKYYEISLKHKMPHFKLGESYYKLNDYKNAEKYFNPDSSDKTELFYLKKIFAANNNKDMLVKVLKNIIKISGEDYLTQVELGELIYETGNYKDSEKYLNLQFIEKCKNNIDGKRYKKLLYYSGIATNGKIKQEETIRLIENGVSLENYKEQASFIIAGIFYSRNDFAAAEKYYRNISSSNIEYNNAKRKILEINKINLKNSISKKDYNSALEYSLKIEETGGTDLENLLIQADIYGQLKKYNEAISVCDKIIKEGYSELDRINLKKAEFYKRKGDYDNWINIISKYSENNSNYIMEIAEYYEQSGNSDKSIDYYGKHYVKTGDYSTAAKIADLYLKSNKEPMAIQYLLKLQGTPKFETGYAEKLVKLLFKYERYDDLENCLVSLNKNNFKPEYYYYLGVSFTYSKKYEKSIESLNSAIKNGFYAVELFELGTENSFLIRKFDQSLKFAVKGLELYPDKSEKLIAYAGKSCFELGDYTQAEKYFMKLKNDTELKKITDTARYNMIKKLFELKKFAEIIEKFRMIETEDIKQKLSFELAKSYFYLKNYKESEKYFGLMDKKFLAGKQNIETIYEYAFVKKETSRINEGFKILSQNEDFLGENELKLYLEFSKKLELEKEYVKTLTKLADLNKQDIDIAIELAGYYFENRDYKNAIASANRLITLKNVNPDKLNKLKYYLAVSYYAAGLYDSAEKYFFDLTSINYPDKRIYTYYSFILNKSGDYLQSAALLKKDRIDPSMEQAAGQLMIDNSKKIMEAYYKSKNFGKCIEFYESLSKEIKVSSEGIIFIAGVSYYHLDNFEKSELLLKQIEHSGYDDFSVKKILAEIYEKKSNYKNLEEYYFALSRTDNTYLKKLGELYKKNNEIDSAIAVFEKIIVQENKTENIITLFDLYKIKNDKRKAIDVLVKYLTIEYNEKYALILSEYFLSDKDHISSLKWSGVVIKNNPKSGKARFLAGMAYELYGDYKTAEENFRMAGILNYDEQLIFPKLLYSIYKQKKYDELTKLVSADYKKTLEYLSKSDETSSEWDDIKLKCYYNTGDYENSSKIILKQIKNSDSNLDLDLALNIFYKTGELTEAENIIKREGFSSDNIKIKYEIFRMLGDRKNESLYLGEIIKNKE